MPKFERFGILTAALVLLAFNPANATELLSVRIATEPAGARVFVNGVERGLTPSTLSLPTGKNELFLYKEGYLPVRKSVEWKNGEWPFYKEMLRRQSSGLVVIADPPGAKVFLDHRPLGASPLAYENLQPGFYQVEVRREGFRSYVATLELKAGTPRVIAVRLEGPPVSLFIEGDAGSRVFLDGSFAGEITGESLVVRARAGSHELRIERNGFASVQHLQLEPGIDAFVGMGELKRMPDARGDTVVKANPRWYLVAAAGGASLVGGVIAGVGYVSAHGARDDYEKAWRRSDIEDAKSRIARNNLFFAAGAGVFAAGLAGVYFAWPAGDAVNVTVTPNSIGLQARFP